MADDFDEEGTSVNQTTFGSDKAANCCVAVNSKAGTPSGLVLKNSAGDEYFLYVDSTGDLCIGTRAQFVANTTGGTAVVGAQS